MLGVFGIMCPHESPKPGGLIDMPMGESMGFMDYLLNMSISEYDMEDVKEVHIYYDIACRYKAHCVLQNILREDILKKTKFMIGYVN